MHKTADYINKAAICHIWKLACSVFSTYNLIVLSITFRNTKTSAIEILLTGYWSGLTGCMQYLVASTAVGFLVVSHLWFSLPLLIYYSLSLRHVGISFSLGFCVFAFFGCCCCCFVLFWFFNFYNLHCLQLISRFDWSRHA